MIVKTININRIYDISAIVAKLLPINIVDILESNKHVCSTSFLGQIALIAHTIVYINENINR